MGFGQRSSMGAAAALCALVLLSAIAALYSAPHAASQTEVLEVEMRRRLLQEVAPAPVPAAQDPANVTTALLLLDAAIDPSGKLANWDPSTSYCTWQGVQCNAQGEPISLNLANLGLQGELPVDSTVWAPLTSLQSIDFQGNNVTGYVPPQIMAVGSLQNISLANNSLQGPIPSTWGNASSLRTVDLSSNNLTGTLPPSWSSLSQARVLNFSANNLGGQIPATWRVASSNGSVTDGMVNLQYIGLGGNPTLCTASSDGGGFAYPASYNSPCSPPYVISLAPTVAPALPPILTPAVSPAEVPELSPAEVPAASPVAEVPELSPAEVPAASPGEVPAASPALAVLAPVASPGSAPIASPGSSPTAAPVGVPTLGPNTALSPEIGAPAPTPNASPAAAPLLVALGPSPLAASPSEAPTLPPLVPAAAPGESPAGGVAPSPLLASPAAAPSPNQLGPAASPLPLLPAVASPLSAPAPLGLPTATPGPEKIQQTPSQGPGLPPLEGPAAAPQPAAAAPGPELPLLVAPAAAPGPIAAAPGPELPLLVAQAGAPGPTVAGRGPALSVLGAPAAAPQPSAAAPGPVLPVIVTPAAALGPVAAAPGPNLLTLEAPAAAPQPTVAALSPSFLVLGAPAAAPGPTAAAPGVLAPGPVLPILPILPLAPAEAPESPELAPAPELPVLAAPTPGPLAAAPAPEVPSPIGAPRPGPEVLPVLGAPGPVPVAAPVAAPAPVPEAILPIIEGPAPVSEVIAPAPAPVEVAEVPESAPEVPAAAAPAPSPLPVVEVPEPAIVAPAAAPAIVPATVPAVAAPAPSNQSVVVNFNANSTTPPPPAASPPPSPSQVPTTGINTTITVTGTTQELFKNLQTNFSGILANITGQPTDYINVLGTSLGSSSGSVTGRRRLLQSAPLTINSFVASDSPSGTAQQFNNSYSDGSLATDLQGIGLTLVGAPTVSAVGSASPPSNANTLGTTVPPSSAPPPAVPIPQSSSGHSAGWYLVRILPAVLGGLLAILVAILIFFFCCRKRSKDGKLRPSASTTAPGSPVFAGQQPGSARGRSSSPPKPTPSRGGSSSLAEGLMFSHKPNPIFDTNDTQSSRGDDYEVLNLSGDRTGKGRSGYSDFDSGVSGDVRWGIRTADPPVGEAPPVPRLDLAETSAQGARKGLDEPFDPVQLVSLPDVDFEGDEQPTKGGSFTSADGRRVNPDSGISYRSAVGPGADTQRTAATNEQFESPKDSPRSQHSEASYRSARSGARSFRTAASSAQTDFFDADSRGVGEGEEAFDYDPYPQARGAVPLTPHGEIQNPLFNTDLMASEEAHPILDNPIFRSTGSPTPSPPRQRGSIEAFPLGSSVRDSGSLEGHRLSSLRNSGSIDERPSIGGHPVGSDLDEQEEGSIPSSRRGGTFTRIENSSHQTSETHTYRHYVDGQPVEFLDGSNAPGSVVGHRIGSFEGSEVPGSVGGHPVTLFDGSEAPGSVVGHRIGSLDGSEAPGSVVGHLIGSLDGSEAPGSVVGHRIGSFDGSEVPASEGYSSRRTSGVGNPPIFTFGGEAVAGAAAGAGLGLAAAGLRGRRVTSFDGSDVPASVQGRPVTSFDGSEGGGSIIGRPITSFDGSEAPGSIVGRPITSFDGSEAPGSIVGRPITSFDGSEAPGSIVGRPITSFDGSEAPGSIVGRPITSFDGSEALGSVVGRPIASFDGSRASMIGSEMAPGSVRGRPGMSFDSEAFGSVQGRAVTSFDSAEGQDRPASMDSGFGSVQGRPVTSFDSTAAGSFLGRGIASFESANPDRASMSSETQGRPVTSAPGIFQGRDPSSSSFESAIPERSSMGSDTHGRPVTSAAMAGIAGMAGGAAMGGILGRGIDSIESAGPQRSSTSSDVQGRPVTTAAMPGFQGRGIDSIESVAPERASIGSDVHGRPVTTAAVRTSQDPSLGTYESAVGPERASIGSDVQGRPVTTTAARASQDPSIGSFQSAAGREGANTSSDVPPSVQTQRISTGSDLPASVQGYRIGSLDGSDLPDSIKGHRISVGSDLPASLQGHRISVGSDLPASVQGHRIGSLDGSDLPGSVVGHRIGSFTGSDVPASIQGHRIGSFDSGSEYPASVQGHRIGSFDGSEVPGSVQGHRVSMGSDVPASVQGYRIGSFDGSEVPGSVAGHRIGSFDGSDIPASEISAHGPMVTSFDGTNTEMLSTIRGGQIPMHSMFSESRESHDSFLMDSQEPRMSFDRPSFDGTPYTRSSSDGRVRSSSMDYHGSSMGTVEPYTSSSEYRNSSSVFNPRGSTGTDSSAENRSGLDLGSRGLAARPGMDLSGQRPSDVRTSSSDNRPSTEPRASMAPLPEVDEASEPVSPQQTATTNPMFGTDADTFSNAEPGFANRNPIFASTGNFTSDGNTSPAPSGQQSGTPQPISGSQSDIWASGRGRGRPVSESGSLQGHAINPMFGTNLSSQEVYNSQDVNNEGVTNPVYDSRRSPSSVGFDSQSPSTNMTTEHSPGPEQSENPLFNNESILDTVDSMGGERNPLFDSNTGQPIATDRGQTNVLFGSDLLDSFETRDPSSAHDSRSRNPVFVSDANRQTTGRTTSTGRTTTMSSTPDLTTTSEESPEIRYRNQPGPVTRPPAPPPAPVEPPLAARGSTRTGGSPPNTGSSTKSQKSPPNTGSSVGSLLSWFKPGKKQ